VKRIGLVILALFVVIQAVPYGRSHANPPVTRAVRWDNGRTKALFAQACQDCHSNLTDWRWYDSIAPGSWLVQHDVEDGRRRLDVSAWNQPQPDIREVEQAILGGGMPPIQYKLVHAGGRLSNAQRRALAHGLAATYRKDPPRVRSDGGSGD
jgi:mono/diheme cytochrome c family protein